ncbi:hypothetical protein GQ457_08G033400 [Hibiscus cannabinus]
MAIKFLDWYLKIAIVSALIGDDKVTVLESEKRAWENSPEAQAMREALNPWRNRDAQERKNVPITKFGIQLHTFTGIENKLFLPSFDDGSDIISCLSRDPQASTTGSEHWY